ncbi:cytochrome-c peroxidase [Desulforhabdus sp. TSK]|uniref:cytochrome-c peroxidase n=1 Tax=Desulforhabdus sp. TSK TaxID=2925014 RepID=UPI001FC7F933|nr:cytochrome c peroxidase [Desulforhabdus sp. TSK]GKT09835.1 cytochrome c [Desulforhabdus sp. TSK]
MRRPSCIILALALVFSLSGLAARSFALPKGPVAVTEDMAALGKLIFFDEGLSINGTQSCAACHAPEAGWTGPDAAVNAGGAVYQGALPHRFGNRKPPSSAYAGDSPVLHQTADGWFGGMFWDGRATGERLGDPLAEQAQGPFLNPLEQGIANAQVLCVKVKNSGYAGLFEQVWGAGSLNCAKDTEGVYEKIARSVAAYERSPEVNPFTSKFDKFWENAKAAGKDVTKIQCPGNGMGCGMPGMGGGGMGRWPNRWTNYRNLGLSDEELIGLAVFTDATRANCASCHTLNAKPGSYPLFTDFGYDNLGVPKNPQNPFYSMPPAWNPDGADWIDYGLGGFLMKADLPYKSELGKQKVPTLRNVAKLSCEAEPENVGCIVKAYGHNGYFKSLEDIVFFYHWRAAMDCMASGTCGGMGGMGGMDGCDGMSGSGCEGMADMFPPPEVDQNRTQLNMFPRMQVDYIVAFLKTLSDGYFQK